MAFSACYYPDLRIFQLFFLCFATFFSQSFKTQHILCDTLSNHVSIIIWMAFYDRALKCALFLTIKKKKEKADIIPNTYFDAFVCVALVIQCCFSSHFLDYFLVVALLALHVTPSPLLATLGPMVRMEPWTWSFQWQPQGGQLSWPLISPLQPWVLGKELSADVLDGLFALSPTRLTN